MDDQLTETVRLRLSVQRAMVSEVTANMAGIHAKLDRTRIIIEGYFFTEPSDFDLDCLQEISGTVSGDFPDPYKTEATSTLISEVKRNTLRWNFLRAEVPAN